MSFTFLAHKYIFLSQGFFVGAHPSTCVVHPLTAFRAHYHVGCRPLVAQVAMVLFICGRSFLSQVISNA